MGVQGVRPGKEPQELSGIFTREVPRACADNQAAVAGLVGFYFQRQEIAAGVRVRGVEGDRVLTANVVGYRAGDGIDFFQVLGEVGNAAGGDSEVIQCIVSFAGEALGGYADGVDGEAAIRLKFSDRFLQSFAAHIVLAVSDYE